MDKTKKQGLYLALVSIHGLIRGRGMELGFDADTGGQTKYVVELAIALSEHPDIERVDLITRQVHDPKVSLDYAQPSEQIAPKSHIIRIPCGPRRYLRKETLWPHLDSFADQTIQYFRRLGRIPDVIHGHYADAGYVGEMLAGFLGVPFVFTGHSLGRIKKERLLEKGLTPEIIESRFNISNRIEAEEFALGAASLVVVSTKQEIDEQYRSYDHYHPKRMIVIPPGLDIKRFHPPKRGRYLPPITKELNRFFEDPKKPMILALSRPDERKNIASLIQAYAENLPLRDKANLALVIGTREDIKTMEKGPREILTHILMLIDKYDLYGSVAYPKYHEPHEVPELYRLATSSKGVFVNPALTEPFGLTIIEAAASGLPVVATKDGGCSDIINMCQNGLLVDPLDPKAIGEAIFSIVDDKSLWNRYSKNGITGAYKNFTWESHIKKYVHAIKKKITQKQKKRVSIVTPPRTPLLAADQLLVCDIDNTLIGDPESLRKLIQRIEQSDRKICLAVATGRHIKSTIKVLQEWDVPIPDLLITSVGSEIYYNQGKTQDMVWKRYIDHQWNPTGIKEAMRHLTALRPQVKDCQRDHKVSYNVTDPDKLPKISKIVSYLRKLDLHANIIYSHQAYLDVLPVRASKGMAIRYIALKWGLSPDDILVAGDSGNDSEMLCGSSYAVVVGNHSLELEKLRDSYRVYFADGNYACGILEALDYYNFLGDAEPCSNN